MRLRFVLAAAAAAFLGIAAATATPVRCTQPVLESRSPDGRHSLTVCRGAVFFAMPGQGSDAPGMVVLRDMDGEIEGLVAVDALGAIGRTVRWGTDAVEIPLAARFALKGEGASGFGNALWRFRAWIRAVPRDEEFR